MSHARPNPPRIELLAAVSENDVIGRGNRLPWHLPDDLKRFKRLTVGGAILMGRKTYDSIGRALPGRLNIVMSRSAGFVPADAVVVAGADHARAAAGDAPSLIVIGGAEIYTLFLGRATRIHLTLVHTHVPDGDAFFDGWRDPAWVQQSLEYHAADDRHSVPFSFITLERRMK